VLLACTPVDRKTATSSTCHTAYSTQIQCLPLFYKPISYRRWKGVHSSKKSFSNFEALHRFSYLTGCSLEKEGMLLCPVVSTVVVLKKELSFFKEKQFSQRLANILDTISVRKNLIMCFWKKISSQKRIFPIISSL
jgi:hypothetical protein